MFFPAVHRSDLQTSDTGAPAWAEEGRGAHQAPEPTCCALLRTTRPRTVTSTNSASWMTSTRACGCRACAATRRSGPAVAARVRPVRARPQARRKHVPAAAARTGPAGPPLPRGGSRTGLTRMTWRHKLAGAAWLAAVPFRAQLERCSRCSFLIVFRVCLFDCQIAELLIPSVLRVGILLKMPPCGLGILF